MSFRICLDGGMTLLTPTIENMIFLSSVCCAMYLNCLVFKCLLKGKLMNSFFHSLFHDLRGFAPIIHAVREVETGLGDLFCLAVVGQ